MQIWIVYAVGPDWTNIEAFATEVDAEDYVAFEKEVGIIQAEIKVIEWEKI